MMRMMTYPPSRRGSPLWPGDGADNHRQRCKARPSQAVSRSRGNWSRIAIDAHDVLLVDVLTFTVPVSEQDAAAVGRRPRWSGAIRLLRMSRHSWHPHLIRCSLLVKMRVASGLLEMRSIGAPWSNSCNSSPVRILHTMPMSPLVAMTRSTPRERSSLQPACSSGWSYSITRSSTKLDAFHMCSVVPAVVAMRVLPRLKRALVTGLSCSNAVTAVPVNTFHNWTCCPARS